MEDPVKVLWCEVCAFPSSVGCST